MGSQKEMNKERHRDDKTVIKSKNRNIDNVIQWDDRQNMTEEQREKLGAEKKDRELRSKKEM